MSQWITEFDVLDTGPGPNPLVPETNAYGGCYIDGRDFALREQISPDCWRMYDHDDEAIEEAGPLYQYATGDVVQQMADYFARGMKEQSNDI